MPRWDDPRGFRPTDREPWRRDARRDRWGGAERRSFGPGGPAPDRHGPEDEPWARDRYAARYDADRARYGRRDEDAGAAGYAERGRLRRDPERAGDESSFTHGGEPYAYGGQEYGVEGQGPGPDAARSPGWGFEGGDQARRGNFDIDDRGVGQSQAGYAVGARSSHEHDFDPDYVRWREEQMRAHDRDYEAWRQDQHRQYDEQYRQFRNERQRHFGETFHQWRSQRSLAGGIPDTSVAPGVGGYGDKSALPGVADRAGAETRPSGMLDPPGHMSADPALQQTGGSSHVGGPGGEVPPEEPDRG